MFEVLKTFVVAGTVVAMGAGTLWADEGGKDRPRSAWLSVKALTISVVRPEAIGGTTAKIDAGVFLKNTGERDLEVSVASFKFKLYGPDGKEVPPFGIDLPEPWADANLVRPGETSQREYPLALQGVVPEPGKQYRLVCEAFGQRAETKVTFGGGVGNAGAVKPLTPAKVNVRPARPFDRLGRRLGR